MDNAQLSMDNTQKHRRCYRCGEGIKNIIKPDKKLAALTTSRTTKAYNTHADWKENAKIDMFDDFC